MARSNAGVRRFGRGADAEESIISTPSNTVDRRALMRGAAWATPVVLTATAAPAMAVSPCVQRVLDWDSFAVGTSPRTATLGLTTVNWSISNAASIPGPNNGTVQAGPKGGVSGNYFRLSMNDVTASSAMSMTITFSGPVTNLQLKIADIDLVAPGWSDRVWLSSAQFTQTFRGQFVSTATDGKTRASAWQSTQNYDVSGSETFGRVDVTYPGPISTVTINYYNDATATGATNTHIGLLDLSFCGP